MNGIEVAVQGCLDSAHVVGQLLARREVDECWEQSSCLEMWTVGGLAGHLARQMMMIEELVGAQVDDDKPQLSAVGFYLTALSGDQSLNAKSSKRIRERGIASAGPHQADLLDRFDAALIRLPACLQGQGPEAEVEPFGFKMLLSEFLLTRCVEMLVHTDDLAVSVGVPSPDFAPMTVEAVLDVLVRVSLDRHGANAVMRGLARDERSSNSISAFSN